MGREAPHLCLLQAPWGVPRALPWLPSCWLLSSGSPWCEPLSAAACPYNSEITITGAWHSPLGGRQG